MSDYLDPAAVDIDDRNGGNQCGDDEVYPKDDPEDLFWVKKFPSDEFSSSFPNKNLKFKQR